MQPLDTVLVSSPELYGSPRSSDALIHFQSEIEKLLWCLSLWVVSRCSMKTGHGTKLPTA
jgi:hypothetical protein